jgi:hypothetical protein
MLRRAKYSSLRPEAETGSASGPTGTELAGVTRSGCSAVGSGVRGTRGRRWSERWRSSRVTVGGSRRPRSGSGRVWERW